MLSIAKSASSIESRLERVERLLELLLQKEKETRTVATQTSPILGNEEYKELLNTYKSYGFQGEPKNPETIKNAIRQVNSLYPDAVELGYTGEKNMHSLRKFFRGKAKTDDVWESILQKNNREYRTVDEKIRDYYFIEILYGGAVGLGYQNDKNLKNLKKFFKTKAEKDGVWEEYQEQYINLMHHYTI